MADYLHNLKPNEEEIDYNEAKQIKNRVSSPEEAKQLIRNQDPPSPPPPPPPKSPPTPRPQTPKSSPPDKKASLEI